MADKITYTLDVDDKGSPKLDKFGSTAEKAGKKAEKAMGDASSSVSGLAEQVPGLGGAMQALAAGPVAAVAAAAAAAGVALIALTSKGIDYADSMNDLADRTGQSVEILSRLAPVAELGGTSLESLSGILGKFAGKVASGDESIKSLNLSTTDGVGAMLEIAQRIEDAKTQTEAIAIAQKAYGKQWQEMMPILKMGGGTIKDVMGGAAVVTADMAAKSAKIKDEMVLIKNRIDGFALVLAEKALPILDAMMETARQIRLDFGLLDDQERRSAGRQEIIDQYQELIDIRKEAVASGAMSENDFKRNPIRVNGKTLQESLAAYDAANKPAEIAIKAADDFTAPDTKAGADAKARFAAASKAAQDEANKLQDIEDSRLKYNRDLWKKQADERAKVELAEEVAAVKEAQARVDAYNAETVKMLELRRAYDLEVEQMRDEQIDAENAAIAALFAPLQGVLQGFSAELLAGEASMASFAESFKSMLISMAAEVMANAAIFGLLSLVSGGAAGPFLGGLSGLSSMILGSFATGTDELPRSGLAMVHQGEAILPASVSAAARMGNWLPAQQYMGQASSVTTNNNATTTNQTQVTVYTQMSPTQYARAARRGELVQGRTRSARSH